MKLNITKSSVNKLPYTEPYTDNSGKKKYIQNYYSDVKLSGFGVCVGSSKKTYYVEKRIGRKSTRVTIGNHCHISADMARKEALKLLGDMTKGLNPNDQKKQSRAKQIVLKDAFDDYLKARKTLKPQTVYFYERSIKHYFSDWQNKPLVDISRAMVQKRYEEIGSGKPGKAQANMALRLLRAVFNFAIVSYEDSKGLSIIKDNPVKYISSVKGWFKVKRRTTYIKNNELGILLDGLDQLVKNTGTEKSKTFRDYCHFLLLTGARKQEGATLLWKNVDFIDRTFLIEETKNNNPLRLPLSDYLLDLLKERYNHKVNEYVFPADITSGHFVSPHRQLVKTRKLTGLTFTFHDFRRTFITIAESLDIPYYALKNLLNHKMSGDVTAGYIMPDVERLRKPMQKITDFILKEAGRTEKAEVIDIKSKQVVS